MKRTRKTSGQTLVEFSLLLPLFLLIVMALFELGRFVFYYAVLNNAVREGTRTAVVQSDCDLRTGNNCGNAYVDPLTLTCATANSTANQTTCAAIDEKLFSLPELVGGATVTINHTVNATDDPIVYIEIVYQFQPVVPGLNLIGNIPMRVESRMLKTPIAKPL